MRTERIIVYSALFGAYDTAILKSDQVEGLDEYLKKFKFVLFTDQKRLKSDLWEVVYVDEMPVENDNARSSYYFKTLPHKALPEYGFKNKTSVWVDSSLTRLNLEKLFAMCQKFKDSEHSLFIEKHPGRNCIYQELETCVRMSKDNEEDMRAHVETYKKEGFPANYGLVETGYQIRNHYNEKLIEFQELLWHEMTTKSKRDQLSWNYCEWKLEFKDYGLFSFQDKTEILWFVDHPNRPKHKEKVLLAGPWFGDAEMEIGWCEYLKEHVETVPYDTVIIGCRNGREHIYDDYADKFILSDPDGEIDRNLLNGKVPRFNVKISGDKDVVQMNPTNEVCDSFKLYDRSESNIHILWATIRPDMLKETLTDWVKKIDSSMVYLHIGVDTEEHKKQLKDLESAICSSDMPIACDINVINSPRKGVTYPSYALSSKLAQDESVCDDDIVIFASDDFFPMDKWDIALKDEFSSFDGALLVNDKYMDQGKNLVAIPIMTVKTLRALNGVIYHPDYIHCWSDNELYDNLKEMKLIKDISINKPEVYFEHRHFSNGKREKDEIDAHHQYTNSEDMQKYHQRKNMSLKQRLEVKRVISFSLWGDDPKYTKGAIENVKIQKQIYPNWVCRFYYDNTVPQDVIDELSSLGAELEYKETPSVGSNGLAWRFEVGFDDTVDRFIIRDTDSRLNLKEVYAVNEWMSSDKEFHIMRDHANHGVPILGGMWGATKGFLSNFKDLYTSWVDNMVATNHQRDKYFNFDQIFLWNTIWPLVKHKSIAHDERFRFTDDERSYPYKLDGDLFVGQSYDENNEPIFDY